MATPPVPPLPEEPTWAAPAAVWAVRATAVACLAVLFTPPVLDLQPIRNSDAVHALRGFTLAMPTWIFGAFLWHRRGPLGAALVFGAPVLWLLVDGLRGALVEVEYAGRAPVVYAAALLAAHGLYLAALAWALRSAAPSQERGFLRVLSGLAVLVLAFGVLGGPAGHHRRRERTEEAAARNALAEAATCLAAHRSATGQFPATLDAACPAEARGLAEVRAHRFTYTPGTKDAAGRVQAYELRAVPLPRTVFVQAYVVDHTGEVRPLSPP